MTKKNFFDAVYGVVETIPAGKVMTYGQIGAVLDSPYSARVVGFAMSSAPAALPCHRVLNRLGEMAPGMIFGGAIQQRATLEAEGVSFLPNGRVDLKSCLFDPYE